jgi:hypothetical protein
MAVCLVCSQGIAGKGVPCPRCDTAYHAECAAYAGTCAVYGCAAAVPTPEPGKCGRVTIRFDAPLRILACWAAGGLGLLGLGAMISWSPAGPAMLAVGVACGWAAGRVGEERIVDGKSRTIWRLYRRFDQEWVRPILRFEECRSLRMVRQLSLQDGRDNHRFGLEIETEDGRTCLLADDVTPEEASRVGDLLSLTPTRL